MAIPYKSYLVTAAVVLVTIYVVRNYLPSVAAVVGL